MQNDIIMERNEMNLMAFSNVLNCYFLRDPLNRQRQSRNSAYSKKGYEMKLILE